MGLLLVYFGMALTVSFVCSVLESVILSITPAYTELLEQKGWRSGVILKRLRAKIDQPLAAILSLNTIANTLGAAGVGAQTLRVYGDAYVAFASGILILAILFFSEIIPKSVGVNYWKTLAPACAYIIRVLIVVMYPLVWLSTRLYSLLQTNKKSNTSREEMIVTAELGALEGSIKKKESQVIRNLLMLDSMPISEIMTPRAVMKAFNENDTVGHIMEKYKSIRFSRIPIYAGDLDNITGLLNRYQIMKAVSHSMETTSLKQLMGPVHRVSEQLPVSAALDQFIKRKEHLFIVTNRYGSTVGLVTLEDAIETLLGVEIVDESDDVVDMRQHALEQWRKKKEKMGPSAL